MHTHAKSIVFATLLMFFSLPSTALACSCAWGGPFVLMAKNATMVLKGKVVAHDKEKPNRPLFMDFQITEVLSGSFSPGPIRIWGDNGFQCRPSVKNFPVGTEWIFAVTGPQGTPSGKGDYHLSSCGDNWLRVDGAFVRGNVKSTSRGAKQQVAIVELRRLLKNKR